MRNSYPKTIVDTIMGYAWWFKIRAVASFFYPRPLAQERFSHIVVLATDFPPHISGGVYRPLSIAKYAASQGWRVTVVTRESGEQYDPAGLELLDSLPNDVKVVRVKRNPLAPSFSWFPRIQGESLLDGLDMFSAALRELRDIAPGVVLATGPLFNSFVAAFYLSKHYGSILVLDYRDEWTQWPFGIFSIASSDYKWENRCLKEADLVIFTTEAQRANQLSASAVLDSKKCHIIPNGWEPADFSVSTGSFDIDRRVDERFIISYVGVFGGHIRAIEFITFYEQILDRRPDFKKKILLRIAGKKDLKVISYIQASRHCCAIELIEHLPKARANDLMMLSNALLLVYTGPFERYIPGKLYDYLATGRPILLYGVAGEASKIVHELHAGFVVPTNDVAAFEAAVEELLCGRSSSALRANNLKHWLDMHTREKISKDLLALISNAIKARST